MDSICVFSGSSPGTRREYVHAADALAHELVRRNIELVYGGGSLGLMGRLADAVLSQGGRVVGVIPEALQQKELQHSRLTSLRVVGSMHERKATMNDLAQGFIALPGGLGTLDETFEILTWAQLGLHAKPVGVLNVCGYYDHLFGFLDHAVAERFIRPQHRDMFLRDTSASALLDAMMAYTPSKVRKWLDRESV